MAYLPSPGEASPVAATNLVVCSTGLGSAERKALEQICANFKNAIYEGDLTDRTTHLIAQSADASSEKARVAKELNMPIVRPQWIFDSSGARVLDPPHPRYLLGKPPPPTSPPALLGQENASPQKIGQHREVRKPLSAKAPAPRVQAVAPPPTTAASAATNFVREPLPLLREAAVRGELSFDAAQEPFASNTESAHLLCGERYALDAPTGFLRQHALTGSTAGRAYTLRELIFGLRCSSLSHADYFLACVTHGVEPVLLLDKKVLIASVLPSSAAASTTTATASSSSSSSSSSTALSSSSAADSGAARLLEGPPLSLETAFAIDASSASSSSGDASAADANGTGAALGEEERSQLLGQLRDAADERAKLNAKVSALAHQLREQRLGMHEQQEFLEAAPVM